MSFLPSMWNLITLPRSHSHSHLCFGWFNIAQEERLYSRPLSLDLPPSPHPVPPTILFPSEQNQIPRVTFKANPGSGHKYFFFRSTFLFLVFLSIYQPNRAASSPKPICALIFILLLRCFSQKGESSSIPACLHP